MKASIILPVYNGQDTIEGTIRSALAQNYNDFEIIVIDDGSTDRSLEIARQYEPSIYCLHTPNRGVAAARNLAVTGAVGDVLLPLDADDLLDPSYLTKTISLMIPGIAIVSTDMQYFGAADTTIRSKVSSPYSNDMPVTSLIRTRAFRDVGGYDTTMMYEDWDLWLRIMQFGWSVALLHEPLFFYRVGPSGRNAMQDLDKEKYKQQILDRHA